MIDANAILVEYLKASGTSLYTLVATRIYCPSLPAGFKNTVAALEVFPRGGKPKIEHEEHNPSVQIKCYGGTTSHVEAQAVYAALYDRLHNKKGIDTASGNIMESYAENEGQPQNDPETGWPFVLSFWRVTMRPKA